MRVLLVKLSSLGDVIHNLPLVSDIARARPDVRMDWVIESPYAEIAAMHPAISDVLPLPLRRLKKNLLKFSVWRDFRAARARIAAERYDLILDSQGLVKSAWVAGWPAGPVAGYAATSAREPLAARCYQQRIEVPRDLHAVTRNRMLGAQALGYELAGGAVYGLAAPAMRAAWLPAAPFVVFLHATSRADKKWPDTHWIELARRLHEKHIHVVLPWGSPAEKLDSERLCHRMPGAVVPPALSLTDAAAALGQAAAVVGVDTGLAHLSVALARPTIGIYVTTQPRLTGLHGGDTAINVGGGTEAAPDVPAVEPVWLSLAAQLPGA